MWIDNSSHVITQYVNVGLRRSSFNLLTPKVSYLQESMLYKILATPKFEIWLHVLFETENGNSKMFKIFSFSMSSSRRKCCVFHWTNFRVASAFQSRKPHQSQTVAGLLHQNHFFSSFPQMLTIVAQTGDINTRWLWTEKPRQARLSRDLTLSSVSSYRESYERHLTGWCTMVTFQMPNQNTFFLPSSSSCGSSQIAWSVICCPPAVQLSVLRALVW